MNPLDLIKKGAAKIVDTGLLNDSSLLGVAKNTVTGLPKASADLLKGTGSFKANNKLGIARNTVIGLPSATRDTAVDIARSVPRSILSTALTVAPKKLKSNLVEIDPNQDIGGVGKFGLGEQPIKDFSGTGKDVLSSFGIKNKGALKYGAPAIGGFTALLDLYPGTAGKAKVAKILAGTEDLNVISKTLKDIGMPETLVKEKATNFVNITDPKKVTEELDKIAYEFKTTPKKERLFPDVVNKIAVEKDPIKVEELLQSTGVAKEQIPTMAQVLAKTDKPQSVSNIIEGIDKRKYTPRTPIADTPKMAELKTKLDQLELEKSIVDEQNVGYGDALQSQREQVRASQNINYGVIRKNIKNGTGDMGTGYGSKTASKLDQLATDMGHGSIDDTMQYLDNLVTQKQTLKENVVSKQYAQDIKLTKALIKNELAIESFLNKGARYIQSLNKKQDLEKLLRQQKAIKAKIKQREKFVKSLPTQKTTQGTQTKQVISQKLNPADTKIVTTDKKLLIKRIRDELRGAKLASKNIKQEVKRRRELIRSIRDTFVLSDKQMATALQGKDFRFMDDTEFKNFLKAVDGIATQENVLSEVKIQLKGTIYVKELQNVENLQKAMKLPTIENMSIAQLDEFDKVLSKFETGDNFLSTRKIETIDKTALAGSRTIREARQKLAQKLGVAEDKLPTIQVGELDRFRWDTTLVNQNPFYKLMVEGFNEAILKGDAEYIALVNKTNKLVKESRKGTSFANRIVPTDNKVFEYLSATNKTNIAKTMTKAELETAEFMRSEFAKALAYEYEMKILQKSSYEDSYITNIRRGFFEGIKDGNLKTAFGEMLSKYKQDEAIVDILDGKTGQVLPLEKYFQFAMQRTGEINPTKNAASAFLSYMQTLERKKALDAIIPEMMAYVDVLTPTTKTVKGLFKDDKLNTFVKEYLNTKKGRTAQLFVKPGGKADFGLRSVKAFTTMLDLAINIPVQLSSNAGVNAALYVVMGGKRYAKGVARLNTKQGKEIVSRFENYTGRNAFSQLLDASKNLPEKVYGSMFVLFQDAVVRANKIHLLGSLTNPELKSGIISTKRLSELQTEAGHWLPVEGSTSVLGATAEGSLATQYKKWALPPLSTAVKNLTTIADMLKNKQNPIRTKEFQELFRVAQIGATVSLIAYAVGNDLEKPQAEQSFATKIINKTLRDALSVVSAIDPQTYTSVPRTLTFVTNLTKAMSDLVRLTEYKKDGEGYNKGDLTAINKFKKEFTPSLVKGSYKSKSIDRIKSIYEQAQKIKETEGQEAANVYKQSFSLSEEENAEYKKVKTAENKKLVLAEKEKIEIIYAKAQKIKNKQGQEAANAYKKFQDFTEEQDKVYQTIKKEAQAKAEKQKNDRSIPELTGAYAKAFFIDPKNASKALFTREKLGNVEGNLVELQRFYGEDFTAKEGSEAYIYKELQRMGIDKKDRGNYNLEHIVPKAAGGDSSPENLRVVDRVTHDSWTPVDIALSKAIKNKKLTRKQVQVIARDLKNANITIEQAYTQIP